MHKIKLRDKSWGILILICLSTAFMSCNKSNFKAIDLRCEYLTNPLGIDIKNPRLAWRLSDSTHNASQTSYQILVDTDSLNLTVNKANVWNSGKIANDSIQVTYKGTPLISFTKYYWKVIYWNQDGAKSLCSETASFETGFMKNSDWTGSWISDGKPIDYKPAALFRKEFRINGKVSKARAYVTAAGLYELSLNGKKVGDRMLEPMFTRYGKRNLYSVYDITSYLMETNNVAGIHLGNGWYNHISTAVWNFDKAPWRNRPRFLANIHIVYEDGSHEVIVTDETWKSISSPVSHNSIYTAEHYNANLESEGWNSPGFDDRQWIKAVKVANPSDNLVAQQMHPIRVVSKLLPVKMQKISNQQYIFHFPENIAGITQIKVNGEEGTVLRIKHGEMLNADGTVNTANIDYHYRPQDDTDPFQTDMVTLKWGETKFSPLFNYKGFQYVEVNSTRPIELTEDCVVAFKMHSDVPKIGYIRSSSELLNKIYDATNNSYLANLFGYPTDCPQREKNGWTGDAHIAIETGLYNFDAITIYEKWMNDFKDEQRADGVLPCIIPTAGWGYGWANGVDWTGAVAIIPWQIYRFYGDSRLLHTMYPNIKKYVDYIDSIAPAGITSWGLGDWIPVKSNSSLELTSSIYYYVVTDILSKTAEVFGNNDDAVRYGGLASKIKNAINDKFLNKETAIYGSGTQTEMSMPLFWGVVPEMYKSQVAYKLMKQVESDNFHLNVGLLGTKSILNALSENGYADVAFKIATQKTFPSWGYWIENGATTLHENWRMDVIHDNSLNHIMFGEIGAWFYKALGGIFPDEKNPGFKHIELRPNFVADLEFFESRHQSVYGWILSKWQRGKNNLITYEAEIPANSYATFYPPPNAKDVNPKFLSSGKHRLIIELNLN